MAMNQLLPLLLTALALQTPQPSDDLQNHQAPVQELPSQLPSWSERKDFPLMLPTLTLGTGIVGNSSCFSQLDPKLNLRPGSLCPPISPTLIHFQYALRFPAWNDKVEFYYENVALLMNGLGVKYFLTDEPIDAYIGASLLWVLTPQLNANAGLVFPAGENWGWGTRLGISYNPSAYNVSLSLDMQLLWKLAPWSLSSFN